MAEILIVEDDQDLLDDLADLLRTVGYRVATAANGSEALGYLRRGLRPCLILLDLMMPVMNGWEFRAEQLADPALSAIPVVIITGAGSDAGPSSVAGYLTKPFEMTQLLGLIKQHC